jgi:hypothetical protein
MSIFKDTLKQYVQDQLTARQVVVAQQGKPGQQVGSVYRDDKFLRYVAGKNAWVKMQSFVDCYNPVFDNNNNITGYEGVKIGTKTYKGSELARKYILEGGTLFEEKDDQGIGTNKFTLRSGAGKRSSAYASDIDLGGDRPLGYRPLPGITSIQINNKSAYGSLREATVKFYAWDKHQLEELELLYMRTGYSVLLEWGWSQYLQSGKFIKKDDGKEDYSNTLDNISIRNFDTPTIDIFYDNDILSPPKDITSDEVIYKKIESLNQSSNGNYDAMLGYVKNFSWQLMDNGGFECTTVLISRGEVISTLKLSSNGPSFVSTLDASTSTPPLSLFESLMLNYSAVINAAEFINSNDPNRVGQFATTSSAVTNNSVSDFKNDFKNRLEAPLYAISGSTTALYNKTIQSALYPSDGDTSFFGKFLLTDGNTDSGVGIEYIKMDYFIALLNLYFNFKDANNKTISQILIPNDTPCLASKNSVSVDPSTCIIYNSKATFITGLPTDGALPKTITKYDPNTNTYYIDIPSTVSDEQFLDDNTLGKIGNIFIAIPKILEIYRSESGGTTDVSVISFLKTLLNKISQALGGINDFQLYTTKSSAQIIDIKYLEKGAGKTKYEFDLLGLKSICRDVKISSRVFESQSTMMAIAAQSGNANVGDLYSSTQNYFNRGLRDRIALDKVIWNDKYPTYFDYIRKIFTNLVVLQNYINSKCIGVNTGGNVPKITYPTPTEISNASSLLKTFYLQLNGDDINFKAIIPFELEIVLDGVAGLVQGQIFKINKNILPSQYSNSNIGFIITGLSHSLQNNDWVTTVKTQVCLLDNESIKQELVDLDKLRNELGKLIERRESNVILWSVLADYMTKISLDVYGYTKAYVSTSKLSTLTWKDTTDALADAGAKYFNESDKDHYFFAYNTYGRYSNINRRYEDTYENAKINSIEFGDIFEPDIEKFYVNEWRQKAIDKATNDGNTDLVTKLNNLKTLDDVRAFAEITVSGQNRIQSVPLLTAPLLNKFLSFPLKLNSSPNDYLKDSFVFRSPDYVEFTKNNTTPTPSTGGVITQYTFNNNALVQDGLFVSTTDPQTFYYRFPKNNSDLFKIYYNYIVDSGFFNSIDAQFLPSKTELNAGKVFSIY